MTDATRFDQFHVKAGSPQGGQFASSGGSGSGGSAAKPHAGHAAAKTPAGARPGRKQRLLDQAHDDLQLARHLEAQLHVLEKQHAAASAAAKHSHAAAAKAKKSGHVVHHHHHTAVHKHHAHHAASLAQQITALKTRIHQLRQSAAALTKQAHAIRAGITTLTGRAAMATTTKAPYGDVTYADPGYQADKQKRYPLDSESHCRAAWSYINMPKNAAQYSGEHLAAIKGRIKAALKKYGVDVSDDSGSNGSSSRAEFMRMYPLEDMHIIRSADGGDGRTVEAFAAVFGQEAEISDHEGHYLEVIDPTAFSRAIDHASRARGGLPGAVKVLYNHGMTIQGTPSERFSMPIGTPVEIRAEARGLLTRTRYNETPLADEVLENIRSGSITSQSFTGRIVRSDPQLRRGDRYRPRGTELTTVRRTELGLREYGPVLWPAYSGAEILGVRMSTPGSWEPDPDEEYDPGTPPDGGPAAGDPLGPETDEHSARYHQHALYRLRSAELRESKGLVW